MKELPIIFNGEMVNAILDDRKTNTRRPFKIQPAENAESPKLLANGNFVFHYDNGVQHKPPYQKGDWIYVREAIWQDGAIDSDYGWIGNNNVVYCANQEKPEQHKTLYKEWRTRPSIHMEKKYARIWLEAVDVKPQRIQDISEAEAIKEGIIAEDFYPDEGYPLSIGYTHEFEKVRKNLCRGLYNSPIKPFSLLWDSIYKAQGKGWNANPWVWAIEFKGLSTDGFPF